MCAVGEGGGGVGCGPLMCSELARSCLVEINRSAVEVGGAGQGRGEGRGSSRDAGPGGLRSRVGGSSQCG